MAEADIAIQDPWRQLGRRYKGLERDKTLPQVTVTRPGPDTEGFYNRLRKSLDISAAANRLAEQKAVNLAERRALEEARFMQQQWGSVDLSGVNPQFLAQQGLSYQDLGRPGKGGTPSGVPLSKRYGYRQSSGYGMRRHPITGVTKLHDGIDFAAPAGTPIYATHSGIVKIGGYAGKAWGNMVVIGGSGGVSTRYAHQSRVAVRPGQRVTKGQVIGYVGATGYATGPHLHYSVLVNGRPVNPSAYF